MQSQWIQRANCKSTWVKMDKMGFGCGIVSGLRGHPDVSIASLLLCCLLDLILQAYTFQSLSLCCPSDPQGWWYSDTAMAGFSSNQTHHLAFGHTLLGLLISRTALAGFMVPYLGSDAVMQETRLYWGLE